MWIDLLETQQDKQTINNLEHKKFHSIHHEHDWTNNIGARFMQSDVIQTNIHQIDYITWSTFSQSVKQKSIYLCDYNFKS